VKPRILVIRGGAIGDFILTLPVLAALRTRFPQAELVVLGYPHIAQLAAAGGLADEVHPIEARALASFFAPPTELPTQLVRFFAGFALILSYLYDPDEVFEQSIRRCSDAQFIAGPHRPDEPAGLHATEVFLKPLERLAIFDADPVPRLTVRAARDGLGSETPSPAAPSPHRPTLAVHPGSGSERKNWPEAHWAELLERLAVLTRWNLLLVGGEAEGDRLDRLAKRWPAERSEIARSWPLAELAGRLAHCTAFAGHDSGITHLAAALGLPGVVLWGETPEAVWRPRSDRLCLLRAAEGWEALSVERVLAALTAGGVSQ
jgi:heptosyltransferase-2